MVIPTLSRIEDWDNSRCSTSGLTSLHIFASWIPWKRHHLNDVIPKQFNGPKSTRAISGCIPTPLRNTTSREIIFLSNGLRSKGQDVTRFGPVKMYRSSILQLPCLQVIGQKRTTQLHSSKQTDHLSPQKRQDVMVSLSCVMHTSTLQGHVW